MKVSRLSVARADLLESLRPIARLAARGSGRAVLEPVDGGLEISMDGISTEIRGAGSWIGRFTVPGAFILGLARNLPSDDPIVIQASGGKCSFGGVSVACSAFQAIKPLVEVSMKASVKEILALRQDHSSELLIQSGLGESVAAAEEQLEIAVAKALRILGSFGVTEADVRALVERAIARSNPDAIRGQLILFPRARTDDSEGDGS